MFCWEKFWKLFEIINDFDCVMILYDNLPVFCFLNRNKSNIDSAKKKLVMKREKFRLLKERELKKSEEAFAFIFEEMLNDMGCQLANKKKIFSVFVPLKMDEYSYCLDLNRHVYPNLTLISKQNLFGLDCRNLWCNCSRVWWLLVVFSTKKMKRRRGTGGKGGGEKGERRRGKD